MRYCEDKKNRLGKKSAKQDIPKSNPTPYVSVTKSAHLPIVFIYKDPKRISETHSNLLSFMILAATKMT